MLVKRHKFDCSKSKIKLDFDNWSSKISCFHCWQSQNLNLMMVKKLDLTSEILKIWDKIAKHFKKSNLILVDKLDFNSWNLKRNLIWCDSKSLSLTAEILKCWFDAGRKAQGRTVNLKNSILSWSISFILTAQI